MDGFLRGIASGISGLFSNGLAAVGGALHGVVDHLATAFSSGGPVLVGVAIVIALLALLVLRR
jgi:hypothetical protein